MFWLVTWVQDMSAGFEVQSGSSGLEGTDKDREDKKAAQVIKPVFKRDMSVEASISMFIKRMAREWVEVRHVLPHLVRARGTDENGRGRRGTGTGTVARLSIADGCPV